MKSPERKKHHVLRIGVMLDSYIVPNWVYYILEQLVASDYAKITLVMHRQTDHSSYQRNIARDWRILPQRITPGSLLFRVYSQADRKLFCGKVAHDAFAPRDAQALLAGVKAMPLHPISDKFTDRMQDADITEIKTHQLDVILRFGFRILKGAILNAAAYGVWSFHHDDNRYYRGGPPMFWEMAEGNPETGSILQILTEELDQGQVIYRSVSATCFTSLFMNRNANYWKTAHFMLRQLKVLYQEGWEALAARAALEEKTLAGKALPGPIYRAPGFLHMTRFAVRAGCRLLAAKAQFKLFNEQWFLAISRQHGDILETIKRPDFEVIKPPAGHFWADPFVVREGDKDFVFLEDYSFADKKGIISVMTVQDNNQRSAAEPVLERPYHLSYPFVFKEAGSYYMIPETAASRQVELYKSYNFPYDWRLERVLLREIEAVDSTLHWQDGLYWLFLNIAPYGAHAQDELHLFYAPRLDGEWTPHKQNPIVSHAGHARPAGRLFTWNGRLLRPAQNSLKTYGHHIVLNEIVTLTPDTYREVYFDRILPEWLGKSLCTHTLNFSDHLMVTDGKKYTFKFR